MLKISARLNDDDFLGTAEELAAFVTDKLIELGFGQRHQASERLVRFYAYEGLLSRPERAADDRRKANFGPLQIRQLLLARLLAERGWDLPRIRDLLKSRTTIAQLNGLIDDLATPNEAEKLFFKVRGEINQGNDLSMEIDDSIASVRESRNYCLSPERRSAPRRESQGYAASLRDLSDSDSPAETLKIIIKKELIRPDISPEARDLFQQLMAFNPSSPGDEPKRERWTRLRLSHWCEAHFNIDGKANPTKDELQAIVDQFSKALMKNYL